jgi:tetratricopeptide (TPR) repeat protein
MFIWIFVYVDFWEIPSVYFILFSVLKDFFEPIFWGNTNTAHAAHIAGNVVGFAIGLILLLTHLVQRDHYDLLAMLDRWRRRKQYESLVAGGYDPFRPTWSLRSKKSGPADPAPDPQIMNLREEIARLLREQNLAAAATKYLELRAIDPRQVLASQDQLDIANQFMMIGQHANAAAAYEEFLRIYTGSHQQEQIMLVLALIYARYLSNPKRAIELFQSAIPRMHDAHQRKWAEDELAHLSSNLPQAPTTPSTGHSPK